MAARNGPIAAPEARIGRRNGRRGPKARPPDTRQCVPGGRKLELGWLPLGGQVGCASTLRVSSVEVPPVPTKVR